MARPDVSDAPTIVVPLAELQELVRASHRNVAVAFTGGAIAGAAALLLAISEGGFVLWVGIFAILGAVLLVWGARESRSLNRRYGPVGRPRQASPFEAFDGMEANREHLAATPFVDPGDRPHPPLSPAWQIRGSRRPEGRRLHCVGPEFALDYGTEETPSPTNSTQLKLIRLFPP